MAKIEDCKITRISYVVFETQNLKIDDLRLIHSILWQNTYIIKDRAVQPQTNARRRCGELGGGTLQSAGKELLARGGLSLPLDLDAVGEGDCKQGHQCRRSSVELVKSVM